ncbi:MAG TPA: RNA pseudouridine synthase, partial [Spirochaetaceae bacterium]|nr:RNA pseudouridine synthase [Spirochaetaceae bacterium]
HQIRAQLAAIGHPVAGDARYGARTDPASRLCLHAHLLEFEHPFTHKVLVFESPVPKVFYQSENPGPHGRL